MCLVFLVPIICLHFSDVSIYSPWTFFIFPILQEWRNPFVRCVVGKDIMGCRKSIHLQNFVLVSEMNGHKCLLGYKKTWTIGLEVFHLSYLIWTSHFHFRHRKRLLIQNIAFHVHCCNSMLVLSCGFCLYCEAMPWLRQLYSHRRGQV